MTVVPSIKKARQVFDEARVAHFKREFASMRAEIIRRHRDLQNPRKNVH